MHIINNNLGEVIKAARKNKKVKQEELAEALGVGPRHIMALENEGKFPSYELLYQLIRFLDIPADSVFRPETVTHTMEQEQFMNEFLSCNKREQRIIIETVRSLIRELREITDM